MSRDLGITASNRGDYYFISYSSEDQDRVREYVKALNKHITLWYDNGIRSASMWKETIAQNIQGCTAVIMFISKNTFKNKDSYVSKEYDMAKELYHKDIHIICLDAIDEACITPCFAFWWIEIKKTQCIEAFREKSVGICIRRILKDLGIEVNLQWESPYQISFRQFSTHIEESGCQLVPEANRPFSPSVSNLYIKGNASTALFLMRDIYYKKIHLLFMDPPYGPLTAQKSVQELQNTLFLCKDFVTEDGILILMSDMDNLAFYKSLCDEIMGIDNFVGAITVEQHSRNTKKIGSNNEYMLIYTPNASVLRRLDDYAYEGDEYTTQNLLCTRPTAQDRGSFYYPIYVSTDLASIQTHPFDNSLELYPHAKNGTHYSWSRSQSSVEELIAKNMLVAKQAHDGSVSVYVKQKKRQIVKTCWSDPRYERRHAVTEIKQVLGNTVPSNFIGRSAAFMREVCKIFLPKDGMLLDLNSICGASARAVMELNAEDDSNRNYILIQQADSLCELTEKLLNHCAAVSGTAFNTLLCKPNTVMK